MNYKDTDCFAPLAMTAILSVIARRYDEAISYKSIIQIFKTAIVD